MLIFSLISNVKQKSHVCGYVNTKILNICPAGKYTVKVCVKVKVSPLLATKALRVGRSIAVPFLRPQH